MVKLLLVLLAVYVVWRLLANRAPTVKRDDRVRREARAVLGVGADADDAAIRSAHRRLLGTLHPDRGGSAELTQRVNAARDVLLK